VTEPHRPRKRFGQHFLVDRAAIDRIVASLDLSRFDRVVEIGPGLGALTVPLLDRLDRLEVIEIDRDLAARLRAAHSPERLVVHECDALEFDYRILGSRLRVVGNLPYNVSTPLLFRIAACAPSLRDATVMLQKEVVQRMLAPPGGAEYGRLTVTLGYRFEIESLFDVAPAAFRPAPAVRSAVVRLVPKPSDALHARNEQVFRDVVTAAFGQRRKTLRNALRALMSADRIEALGIDPNLRGENLAIGDFVRIANALDPRATAEQDIRTSPRRS
jgi:16S rRNA (adenine1518-N6/adenine1519-N6)-dimethyltransferase